MAENEENGQEEQDLMGYASVQDMANALRASGTEAKKWKTAAEQAQQAATQTLAQLQALTMVNPRQDVPQRNGYQTQLEEAGVPYNPVVETAREEARRIIRDEFFEPMQQQSQARNKILGRYGQDYVKFESDVYAYIESDPELSRSYNTMVKADPVGAMDYAFLKFGDAQRREHKGRPRAESSTEAQIPSNRSGESRRNPNGTDDLRNAWEKYRDDPNAGTARQYAKARLRTVIKDEWLNQ
jgi:hypothetical protein